MTTPITITPQQDEYQYKKTLGVAYENPGSVTSSESISSLPYIINSQIMANNIPPTAPTIVGTGTTVVGGGTKYTTTNANIFYYTYLPLTITSNNYAWLNSANQSSNLTTHSIPSTYDQYGSYSITVSSPSPDYTTIGSNNTALPWIFDYATGILTFTGSQSFTQIYGIGAYPYISFWRYEGPFGSTTQDSIDIFSKFGISLNTFGSTWIETSAPNTLGWQSVSLSASGQYQTAVIYGGGPIYTSSDFGTTWNSISGTTASWNSVSLSATGQYQTAVVIDTGNIYTSSDFGSTWNLISNTSFNWQSVSLSASGQYQTAVPYATGNIYTSSDFGLTWASNTSAPNTFNWTSVSLSASGQYQTAVVDNSSVGTGRIYTSSDFGTTWTVNTSSPSTSGLNWQSVSLSATGQYQTACDYVGSIYTSIDFGTTWTANTSAPTNLSWYSVSLSATGQYQSALVRGGQNYTSSDFGNTWAVNVSSPSSYWTSVSVSSSGQYQTAVVSGGGIYTSTTGTGGGGGGQIDNDSLTIFSKFGISLNTFGSTWTLTSTPTNLNWRSISLSASGQYQTAVVNGGGIYTSSTFGNNWTQASAPIDASWVSVSLSATGQYQTAVELGGGIWISYNFGTWTQTSAPTSYNWTSVSLSASGQYQTAVVNVGGIYTSSDFGNNWTLNGSALNTLNWNSVSLSASGQYQTAVVGISSTSGYIYTSSDFGSTWTVNTSAQVNSYFWNSVSLSATGQYQTTVAGYTGSGVIYTSIDFGTTWTQTSAPLCNWFSVSLSATGQYQTAVSPNNTPVGIYTSSDFGYTWVQKESTGGWVSVSVSSSGQYQTAVTEPQDGTGSIYTSTTGTGGGGGGDSLWTTGTPSTNIYYNAGSVSIGMTGVNPNPSGNPPTTLSVSDSINITNSNGSSTLSINGPIYPNDFLDIFNSGTNTYFYVSLNGGVGAANIGASTNIWVFSVNGDLTCTSVTTTSDYRRKEDIIPLDLEKYSVDNLNPVYFKFKDTGKESIGVIAHELQEHYPFLVEGEKDGETNQSVNYSGLIGVLIKEIQELKQRVKQLEKK
jgi:hypothetical protein